MRISDWSSDVCSSDLATEGGIAARSDRFAGIAGRQEGAVPRMAVVDRATEIQPRHPARRELELQFGTLGPHAAGIGGDEREGLRVLEVDLEILVLVAVQRNVRSQLAIEPGRFQTTFTDIGRASSRDSGRQYV